MKPSTGHQWLVAAVGVFLAVGLVLSSIWLVVRNGGGEGTPPAGAPAATSPGTAPGPSPRTSPGPVPAPMTVKVYFHRGPADDPTRVVALRRSVPRSPKVATAALTQLLAGPTAAERRTGHWSLFNSTTARMLRSVRVADSVGYADFRDLRPVIPSAGSSAGTAALLAELGPLSRVVLGTSTTAGFSVFGVSTDTIRVDRPAAVITPSDLAVVTSPLTVSGEALAVEGAVDVRVVQVSNATVRQLGVGRVTGGGDVMRPFTGRVSFATPSTDTGWVLATELSADNGTVTKATAVQVAFTPLTGRLTR